MARLEELAWSFTENVESYKGKIHILTKSKGKSSISDNFYHSKWFSLKKAFLLRKTGQQEGNSTVDSETCMSLWISVPKSLPQGWF